MKKNKVDTQSFSGRLKNGKTETDFMYLHHTITKVFQLISESGDDYYNKLIIKLNNSKTSSKNLLVYP